ncbi:ABC transporter substrate-binding protein [Jonesiaceae bacterium BS-20]|uniref:ABC transporter substrate-binding protein n=1 Tax=Jonesiaceae bacterium BS-20 TaxID=3120821 RepID=A0AAU7DY42_9MICO
MKRNLRSTLIALPLAALLVLAGCSSSDPLATEKPENGDTKSLVIGSQDYYSNEIIAEIYAQSLEAQGYSVDRQFRIGQREIYVPEIEAGSIDLFPEYSGPLLQYWDADSDALLAKDVYTELAVAAPEGLRILAQSPATDQDSYVVTKEFADQWGLETIADLSKVTTGLTLGANSEAESRPNGPKGLLDVYGVTAAFTPIEDGGGPLTIKALKDNAIQLAIIYSADPSVSNEGLVSLKDTKGLFLASHVVPIASDNVDEKATEIINEVSSAMTAQDLVEMNARSVNEQLPAKTIAADWLKQLG